MRRTKIVCTIGPASEDEGTLRSMMQAGMDVARLTSPMATIGSTLGASLPSAVWLRR